MDILTTIEFLTVLFRTDTLHRHGNDLGIFIYESVQRDTFPIRMLAFEVPQKSTLRFVYFLTAWPRTEVRWCLCPMEIHIVRSYVAFWSPENLHANHTKISSLSCRLGIFRDKCFQA